MCGASTMGSLSLSNCCFGFIHKRGLSKKTWSHHVWAAKIMILFLKKNTCHFNIWVILHFIIIYRCIFTYCAYSTWHNDKNDCLFIYGMSERQKRGKDRLYKSIIGFPCTFLMYILSKRNSPFFFVGTRCIWKKFRM